MINTKSKNINEKLNELSLPFLMYDITMKAIFTDEVNILAKMVSDITGIDYKLLEDNVVLETNEIPISRKNEKTKKCDFILKIDKDNILNLEINTSYYPEVVIKNLSYLFGIYSRTSKKGKKYNKNILIRQVNLNCYDDKDNNNWETSRPLEKITSDTTMIWFKKQRYDWTYYVDAFDDSIIGSDIKPFYHGVSMSNHKSALNDMLNNKIKRGYKSQETIFHSDQGTIYSSVAFNNAHKDYNIKRSMSRIGTPTDNPIIESKKGWLKKEIYIDFNQEDYETVEDYINAII